MDEHCRGKTTTYLTPSRDGPCKRTTATVEHGTPLALVAKRGHYLFIDKDGNLCTSHYHGAQASRRLYLVMQEAQMRFTGSIGHATLLSDPSQRLQRIIEMVQINCEHCARIEIGNDHRTVKVTVPRRTPYQVASLRAKMKADRTGRPVAVRSGGESVSRPLPRTNPKQAFSLHRPRMG